MRWIFLLFFAPTLWAADYRISEFGGLPDGSDTTPAWDAAISTMEPGDSLEFDAGAYRFFGLPDTITQNGLFIRGRGVAVTQLIYHLPLGVGIMLEGNGTTVRDISLWSAADTRGGVGLYIWGTDDAEPFGSGKHIIENVVVSGEPAELVPGAANSGTWNYASYWGGQKRTLPPIGLRGVIARNFFLLNADFQTLVIWGCHACILDGGAYQGRGTSGKVVVGGGTLNTFMDGFHVPGPLIVWPGALRHESK